MQTNHLVKPQWTQKFQSTEISCSMKKRFLSSATMAKQSHSNLSDVSQYDQGATVDRGALATAPQPIREWLGESPSLTMDTTIP